MITRVVIEKRIPFADGHEFPITGGYEKIIGKLHGEVDPRTRLNRVIINIDKAPRNRRGRVEYWSDFCILKPLDMARGNRKVLFDAPNRGNKRVIAFLNDAPPANDPSTPAEAGNGFLMREGYTIAWCGWQGDLIPEQNSLVMGVPVATDRGKEIIRLVRTELVTDQRVKSLPLSGDDRVRSYEAAFPDPSLASLTGRQQSYGRRVTVSSEEWKFATCSRSAAGQEEATPSAAHLYLRSGFMPGHIYELIYPAKNPLVLGLGFAAVRDFVAFLRYGARRHARAVNPLSAEGSNGVRQVYAWGRSQSGRFLRDFVYHGFNQDEAHRKVFDAVAPHAAGGGRLFLNYEFARPVTSSQQHTDQLDPELFPFAYTVVKDPQTGRRDGILKRPRTDPVLVHTQTSTEYWQKRGCLVHTDGRGRDIRLPEKVRLYVIASAQHNSPFGTKPKKEATQQLTNPLTAGEVLRALLVALDRWVTFGVKPPASRYPKVADGTLVPPNAKRCRFPKIPGVRFSGLHNRQLFLDYGSRIVQGRIEAHPPRRIGNGRYAILVPQVDADGNDVAGIRLPAVEVPLGTHAGWNLQSGELAENELAGLLGSFIPFARTRRERRKNGDPRMSLEERYEDDVDYVIRVSRATRMLLDERLLLPEDAERIIDGATQFSAWLGGREPVRGSM